MRHRAVDDFWELYDELPRKVRLLADKNFRLLKSDPSHPSLEFKCLKPDLWSVRIGLHYRALAYPDDSGFVWFWIGSHAAYDRLIR